MCTEKVTFGYAKTNGRTESMKPAAVAWITLHPSSTRPWIVSVWFVKNAPGTATDTISVSGKRWLRRRWAVMRPRFWE